MKYKLCWRSKLTGLTGKGAAMARDLAEAWLLVAQQDYPECEYWLEVA